MLFASLTIPPAAAINSVAGNTMPAAGWRQAVPIIYGEPRLGALILNVLPHATNSSLYLVQCLWGYAGGGISSVKLNGEDLPSGSSATHYDGTQGTADSALVAAFAAQSITYADTLAGFAYSVLALPVQSFTGRLDVTALVKGRILYDSRPDYFAAYQAPTTVMWNTSIAGVTMSVEGTGIEDGLPYIDYRWQGTNTSGAVGSATVQPPLQPAASPGETWKAAYRLRRVGGSMSGVTGVYVQCAGLTSGGAYVAGTQTTSTYQLTTDPLRKQRLIAPTHTMQATTAKMRGIVVIAVPAGNTIDITIRVASPQVWKTSVVADVEAWGDSPALATADFLASSTYGTGSIVDWVSVRDVADADDALVGGSEKRRTLSLALTQPSSVEAVAEALRAYAGCWLVPGSNGVRMVPDADGAATATYAHSSGDIAGIAPIVMRDAGSAPTAVEVVYSDTSTIPWRSLSRVAQLAGAGSTLPWRLSVVQMPGVTRSTQAYREASERLNKLSLGATTTTMDVFDIGVRHDVGDLVEVTHPIGLSAQKMRVVGVEMTDRGRWRMSMASHDAAAYSDAVDSVAATAVAGATIVPGPPGNVSGLSGTVGQGSILWSWSAPTEEDYAETQLRLGGSDWASATPIWAGRATWLLQRVSAAGAYTIRAKHVTYSGQASATAASASATVGVDSVAAGGANLVRNSSFEVRTSLRPHGFQSYVGGTVTAAFVDVAGRLGGKAFAVKATASGTSAVGLRSDSSIVDGDITGGLVGGWVASRTYTVSFWAKKVSGSGFGGMRLDWVNAPSSLTEVSNPTLTTSWQRYVYRVTRGATVESTGNFYAVPHAPGNYGAYPSVAVDDEVHIDEFKIEEGELSTTWGPAREDLIGLGNPVTASNVSTFIDADTITDVLVASDAGPVDTYNPAPDNIISISVGPYPVATEVVLQFAATCEWDIDGDLVGPFSPWWPCEFDIGSASDGYGATFKFGSLYLSGGEPATVAVAKRLALPASTTRTYYARSVSAPVSVAPAGNEGYCNWTNVSLVAIVLKR